MIAATNPALSAVKLVRVPRGATGRRGDGKPWHGRAAVVFAHGLPLRGQAVAPEIERESVSVVNSARIATL
jgi:hypothetical protein